MNIRTLLVSLEEHCSLVTCSGYCLPGNVTKEKDNVYLLLELENFVIDSSATWDLDLQLTCHAAVA